MIEVWGFKYFMAELTRSEDGTYEQAEEAEEEAKKLLVVNK